MHITCIYLHIQNLSPWVSYTQGNLDSAVGMKRPSPDCEGYLRSSKLEGTPVIHEGEAAAEGFRSKGVRKDSHESDKEANQETEKRWHRKLSKEICRPRMRQGKVGMADGFVRVNLQK